MRCIRKAAPCSFNINLPPQMWMMDNDDKYDVEKGDNDEDDDDDGDDDGDIYIMMKCLCVCL